MSNVKDLIGQRFGRLLVIKRNGSNNRGSAIWLCKCNCGNEVLSLGYDLRVGKILSCGCYHTDVIRKPKGNAAFHRLFYSYKARAKKRNLIFELKENEFKEIVSKNCFYCGKEPSQIFIREQMNGGYIYNGVDRLNNLKGYTKENCIPCCSTCNYAKRKMSEQEFKTWIIRIYNNYIQGE